MKKFLLLSISLSAVTSLYCMEEKSLWQEAKTALELGKKMPAMVQQFKTQQPRIPELLTLSNDVLDLGLAVHRIREKLRAANRAQSNPDNTQINLLGEIENTASFCVQVLHGLSWLVKDEHPYWNNHAAYTREFKKTEAFMNALLDAITKSQSYLQELAEAKLPAGHPVQENFDKAKALCTR